MAYTTYAALLQKNAVFGIQNDVSNWMPPITLFDVNNIKSPIRTMDRGEIFLTLSDRFIRNIYLAGDYMCIEVLTKSGSGLLALAEWHLSYIDEIT